MVTASQIVLAFTVYAFLGWVLEGNVRCLLERRLVNPGFLTGPFVPIYGVGALCILAATSGVRAQPLLVFAIGVVVATAVEFVGHLLLERLLGVVLWDYSDRFGNIQGRVCLGNSVGFGVAALAVVYLLWPLLSGFLVALDPLLSVGLASGLLTVMLLDFGRSLTAVLRVRPEILSIQGSLDRIRQLVEERLEELGAQYDQRQARLLNQSRKVLTRLESAFPRARTSPRRAHSDDQSPAERELTRS